MMKMLPGMVVINPCDFNQTKAATIEISKYNGPVYLRFGRPKVPNFTPQNQNFKIGKGIRLVEGGDVTIVCTGHLVWHAIESADLLKEKGISVEVINIHTIKPLDEEIILKSIEKTGCVVSAEEHNTIGGLGESVASLIVKNKLVPMEFVGVNDQFGESGKPSDLMKKYGLSKESIIESCEKVLKRK
jgi:transketolase